MPQDPFRRAGWYGWAIVAVLLVLVPVACGLSQAKEQAQEQADPARAGIYEAQDARAGIHEAQDARADGEAVVEDVQCMNGWCIVRQDTLRQILGALQTQDRYIREVGAACGWKGK